MAYTNPIAIAMGVPVILGMFLAVFGYRIGKDVKKTGTMTKEVLED